MGDAAKQIEEWTGEPRLAEMLHHHYGLRLIEAEPRGGVFCLTTDRGHYALKRVREREEMRWSLVEQVAQHLSETGEIRIQAPLKNRRGKLTFAGLKNRFVLLPWIEAEVKDWRKDAACWPRVARALARFHIDTRGFHPHRSATSYTHTGKWEKIWGQMEQSLTMFKMAADISDQLTPVDRVWIRQCTFAEGMVDTALRYLKRVGGDAVVSASRKSGEVCHCNLHRKNVLWDRHGGVHFIDWNCITLDVRSRDLARLSLYAYGRTGRSEAVFALLKGYQEIAPLDEAEYGLIYAQLLFPHQLIHSLHQIYQEQKVPSHLAKGYLSSTVEREELKSGLLRDFPAQVKAVFGVSIPRVDWLDSEGSGQ
ncbi:phosphotransferase [Salinithrix halophila]|uniref:Phosphotransferase n=1 Tax=Salinithrix halophila TaxID=1485204 RepID=A0ABV8JFU8_9BACL